jgi:hypothetical protein
MAVGYPAYDKFGDALIHTIGSFWYSYFEDRATLKTLYRAGGHEQEQVYLDFLTAVATISRFETPVFKTENWYLLVLKKSDRDHVYNTYGQTGLVYDGTYEYGDAQQREILFPLPDDPFFGKLAQAKYTVYNRVVYPSKSWTAGLDVEIDYVRGVIKFRDDPFDSEYVARREVIDEAGIAVDEEVGLWLYKGEFDLDLVYKHWGFAVGVQLQSSEFYKEFVNALWDMYVLGSNMAGFEGMVSATLGIPLVREPVETVERLVTESDRKLVITDKTVYEFSSVAHVIVTVGQRLVVGQTMVDDLKIVDLSGTDVDAHALPALTFGRNFLSGGYFAELTFENRNVALEYLGLDEDNKAVVLFEVGGFPGDVEHFFEKAQTLGKQPGNQTLAELLDLRDHPIGEPLPENLPTTINPLEFVLNNIMRNHLILIKVRSASILDGAPGLSLLRKMRDVVPPHTTFIVYVEVTADADELDMSQAGDDEVPGVVDIADRFVGLPVDDEELAPTSEVAGGEPSYEDVVVRVYLVSETCEGLIA